MKAASSESSFKPETPLEREEREARYYNAEEGMLYNKDGYFCEKCKNKGYIAKVIMVLNDPHCVLDECECMDIRRSLSYMRASGMADLGQRCTFDNFETDEPWQAALKAQVMEFTDCPDGRWLYIGGQSGSGKSHLGIAAATKLMKDTHKKARYYVWPDEIRKTWGDNEAYSLFVRNCQEVPILYLDDLFKRGDGNRSPSEAEVRTAFAILNHRYNNPDGITIISSEFTLREIIEIDEATGGRIYQRTQDGTAINIQKDQKRNFRLKGEVVI